MGDGQTGNRLRVIALALTWITVTFTSPDTVSNLVGPPNPPGTDRYVSTSFDVELRTDAGPRLIPVFGDTLGTAYTVQPVGKAQRLSFLIPRDSSCALRVFPKNRGGKAISNVVPARATAKDSTMYYRLPSRWWGGKGTGTDWNERPAYDDTIRYARGIYTTSLSPADSSMVWMETNTEAQQRNKPCHYPPSWRTAVVCP